MKIEFIAEVSSNHNRDLDRCLAFIDRAASVGCAGVKFQLFKIQELFAQEILIKSKKHRQREAWELPVEFLPELSQRCREQKIKFGCTPFYLKAVNELYPYVDFYKIASYEILWKELLKYCASTGKPVVLSTGMAVLEEVLAAVEILKDAGCRDLTLLHCVSGYPTPPQECNLAAIETLRQSIQLPVGWSDHSANPAVITRAVHRWGATMIELHLDIDGTGEEFAMGHCWLPHQISHAITMISDGYISDGTRDKGPTPIEVADREWRADPCDGLRPMKSIRKDYQGDEKVFDQPILPSLSAIEAMTRNLPEVDFNSHFSQNNVWTSRILGLEPFQQKRDEDLVTREYEKDSYSKILDTYRDNPQILRQLIIKPDQTLSVVSLGERLLLSPLNVYYTIARYHMWKTLQSEHSPFICELGAGYGPNLLWYKAYGGQRQIYAGEYSESARILGGLLGLEIHSFNFYLPETYRFIKEHSLLFTSHAIEQIPDANVFIAALKGIRDRVKRVIHFEPVYREDRRTLIGLMRNRYAKINDYNTNLMECLKNDPEINILSFEPDLYGINPLNPSSILVWEFR